MRVAFVIYNMNGGGAQRALANMANHWAPKGWDLTVITLRQEDTPHAYDLDERVQVADIAQTTRSYRHLGKLLLASSHSPLSSVTGRLHRLVRRKQWAARNVVQKRAAPLLALRSALVQSAPDLIISFMDHANVEALISARGLEVPVIVSERRDPYARPWGLASPGGNSRRHFPRLPIVEEGWEGLRTRYYRDASALVLQTRDQLEYFSGINVRAVVIPNPVLPPQLDRPRQKLASATKTLLAVGRLDPVKGFDMLLRAFGEVAVNHSEWSLEIRGEGPMRATLEDQAQRLGLNGRVRLPGFTDRLQDVIASADLFVMSSRSEGFPNALAEAMAGGLPAVSFDCPSGPRNIIRDGVDGVLVPPNDVGALAEALDRLMKNEEERRSLAARAPDVQQRFGLETVMAMWEALINDIVGVRERRAM